jgi:nucleotide-binding universal stress UspA family protein
MAKRRIAVGIDFSEYSDVALEQATWLAGKIKAELVLVHVGAPPLPGTGSLLPSVRVWEKIIEQRTAEEGLKAKNLAKKIASHGVPATHHLVDGDPAEQLARVADEEQIELIVVGTHGLTGAQFFLLGSAAQGVVRHARCNVMVARSSESWGTGPKRILVATDFTDYAEDALRSAVELAPDDATIDIVHCWQVPIPAAPSVAHGSGSATLATLAQDLEKYAEERGKALIEKFSTSRLNLNFEALAGPAGATVIDHAKREPDRYDLIVTGSHGRRGFRRFFLGSVAEKIVRHAPCSVLVVHRQTEDKAADKAA